MKQLHAIAYFQIHNGKLDEFKNTAKQILKVVKEKDKETLLYDWYFNPDQSMCIVRETYANSEAVLEHMANLGDVFGQILSVATLRLDIFGIPSQELIEASKELNITYYSYFQGL